MVTETEKETNMNANASFSDMYGSRYISAADLDGREAAVTITKAYQEMLPDRQTGQNKPKVILTFAGKQKGLVVNKINANKLAKGIGTQDWKQWVGAQLVLYTEETPMGDGVRVRIAQLPPKPAQSSSKTASPELERAIAEERRQAMAPVRGDMEDEVPF